MSVSDFLDLMPATVSVTKPTAKNEYGEYTTTSSTSYRARIVSKQRRIVNNLGEEISVNTEVWLATTTSIPTESVITFADSSKMTVRAVDIISDEKGTHHVKVYGAR